MDKIKIKQVQLSSNEIQNYFESNYSLFIDMFERVNIVDYSVKISSNAAHFCAYCGVDLIGFMACYFNHPAKESGYITTLSVSPKFQKMGIGKNLLMSSIEYALENEFKSIGLEVRQNNLTAIALYKKLGFEKVKTLADSFLFEKKVI